MNIVDTLEAVLFAAGEPVKPADIALAIEATERQVDQALEVLQARLERGGALQVVQIAGGYQLCTKQEHAGAVANFLKPQRNRLSRSLLEVLAIVAYRQPLTQAEIDSVRGVQSDYGLRGLLERRLVHEVGRKNAPGRPFLYGTTQEFLHQFKLSDLCSLPPLTNVPLLQVHEGGLAVVAGQ